MFVVLYLIQGVRDRSRSRYLDYWAWMWAVIMITYLLKGAGAPSGVLVLASLASSSLAILSGAAIDYPNTVKRRGSALIAFGLALAVLVALASMQYGTEGFLAYLSSGYSCIAILYFGLIMGVYVQRSRSKGSYGRAQPASAAFLLLTMLAFISYALLQLTSPYLSSVDYGRNLLLAALVLKTACALSVVYSAIVSFTSHLEHLRRRAEHRRERASDRFKRLEAVYRRVVRAIRPEEAAKKLLAECMQMTKSRRAVLLMQAEGYPTRVPCLVEVAQVGLAGRGPKFVTVAEPQLADQASKALRKAYRRWLSGAEVVLVQRGWWAIFGHEKDARPLKASTRQRVKEMLTIGIWLVDLVAAKDLNALGERTRQALAASDKAEERIRWLENLTREEVAVQRAQLIAFDKYEPRNIDIDLARIAGVSFADSHSMVLVPIVSMPSGELLGQMKCEGKGKEGSRRQVPFAPLDQRRLEVLAGGAAVVIEAEHVNQLADRKVWQHIHDLTAPVAGMRNLLQWLKMNRDSKQEEKVAMRIEDGLSDGESAVQQIRSLKETLAPREVQASATSTEVVDVFRDIVQVTKEQLRQSLPPGAFDFRAVGFTDSVRLRAQLSDLKRVFWNIMSNGTKYHRDDWARLEIEFRRDEKELLFVFRDWGIGIPEGWDRRIFGMGERAPNARESGVDGSGLGLSSVAEILHRLGGRMWLERHREPTEFVVTLPASLLR